MIKRTDSSGGWVILDQFRSGTTLYNEYLAADDDAAEGVDHASLYATPEATGFTISSHAWIAGGTHIWAAFA